MERVYISPHTESGRTRVSRRNDSATSAEQSNRAQYSYCIGGFGAVGLGDKRSRPGGGHV